MRDFVFVLQNEQDAKGGAGGVFLAPLMGWRVRVTSTGPSGRCESQLLH